MHPRIAPAWTFELPQVYADTVTLAIIGAVSFAFVCYCIYRVYRQIGGRPRG